MIQSYKRKTQSSKRILASVLVSKWDDLIDINQERTQDFCRSDLLPLEKVGDAIWVRSKMRRMQSWMNLIRKRRATSSFQLATADVLGTLGSIHL